MTIKENIEIVLKTYNAYGEDEIYNNVKSRVISWIEDQSRIFRYDKLKKTSEISITPGTQTINFPDDYSKIENATLIDTNSNQYILKISDIKDYDFLAKKNTTGLPAILAIDLYQQKFYLSPIPDKNYTLILRYYAFLSGLTENDTVFLGDKIIQQIAYIYLLQYDRLDSTTEELKLENMLREYKRNMLDLDGNVKLKFDKHTYKTTQWNFEL